MEQKRIAWVDMAKGIGILAIVLGHVLRGEGLLSKAVYAFHVPLFFFLSGYIHRPGQKYDPAGRARRLLVPYVIFGLVSIAVYGVLGKYAGEALGENQHYTFSENLGWLAYGVCFANSPLWFLPSQFVMELLLRFFGRLCLCADGKSVFARAAVWSLPVLVSGVVIWLYFEKLHFLWPWNIQSVFCLLPFAWAGYIAGRISKEIRLSGSWHVLLGFGGLITGLALGVWANGKIQYLALDLGSWPLFYGAAFLIVGGICLLLANMPECYLLKTVGKYSMAVLLMHKFPVLFFQCLCPGVKGWLAEGSTVCALAVTVASAAMCIAAGLVLQVLWPESIGMRGKRLSSCRKVG